jgi:uncharacterized protein (TIGR02246 family)
MTAWGDTRAARRSVAALVGCVALLAASARAEPAAEAAIRAALTKWAADFNAGNAREICDLFAPDLRYDYRGFPERGYQAICDLLQRSLADRTRRFRYSLDLKEILVSGDLAAARLVWTLTVTGPGTTGSAVSEEPGLDIFRRQPDGAWRIIRYIAYEAPR